MNIYKIHNSSSYCVMSFSYFALLDKILVECLSNSGKNDFITSNSGLIITSMNPIYDFATFTVYLSHKYVIFNPFFLSSSPYHKYQLFIIL